MIPSDNSVEQVFKGASPLHEILAQADGASGVVPSAFAPNDVHRDYILRVLRLFAEAPSSSILFRFWHRDVKLRDQAGVVKAKSVRSDDNLEDWIAREWGSEEFCIVLEQLERIDEALAVAAARYLQSNDVALNPGVRISLAVFFGSYGFSPFGVHQDRGIERVLHFHSGPGVKTLHTWTDADLIKPHLFKYPDADIIRKANSFRTNTGDVLIIESPDYHIGSAPELCTNLLLSFNQSDPFELLSQTAAQLNWAYRPALRTHAAEKFGLAQFPANWHGASIENVLDECAKLHAMAIASNGGLAYSPVTRKGAAPMRAAVSSKNPDIFPLKMAESFGQHIIAVRAAIRPAPDIPALVHWCEKLAEGQTVTTAELLTDIPDKAEKAQAILFLQWLYSSIGMDFTKLD